MGGVPTKASSHDRLSNGMRSSTLHPSEGGCRLVRATTPSGQAGVTIMSVGDDSLPVKASQTVNQSINISGVRPHCAVAVIRQRQPKTSTQAGVVTDALACVEDVRLAEMWSQGVFIDRRHGLAVVDLVLQLLASLANLLAASDRIKSSKLVRRKQQSCALDWGRGSTYVSDSLDSSYGGRWSRTLARA